MAAGARRPESFAGARLASTERLRRCLHSRRRYEQAPRHPRHRHLRRPGGLGEGFSRYHAGSRRAFRTALSIEKDPAAHRTLTLRAFLPPVRDGRRAIGLLRSGARQDHDRGSLRQASAAGSRSAIRSMARRAGLSETTVDAVRGRVTGALAHASDWVLLGGPPCQAYSLVGRSRNRGIKGYRFESDHKTTLYLEYLQLIADFWPAVFVLENVKGLLPRSSTASRCLPGSCKTWRIRLRDHPRRAHVPTPCEPPPLRHLSDRGRRRPSARPLHRRSF